MKISRSVKILQRTLTMALAASVAVTHLTLDREPARGSEQKASVADNKLASTCTFRPPTKVEITSPHQNISLPRSADCTSAQVVDARWEARRSDGTPMYELIYRWNDPVAWNLFDNDSLQLWTWSPTGARTSGDVTFSEQSATNATSSVTSVPQNTPTTSVRMGSLTAVGWTPDEGTGWNFFVNGSRYAATPEDFIKYAGAKGSIQKRTAGTSNWTVLASFTLNSSGQFVVNLPNPSVRTEYRSVLYDAQYIFGSISPDGRFIDP